MDLLRQYADGLGRVGRGRLIGHTRRLKLAGYIKVEYNGYYSWVAFITAKGRDALAAAVQ